MSKQVELNGRCVAVRNGLMERVWEVRATLTKHGFAFTATMYVRGTEQEMREYLDSEMPEIAYRYSAVPFENENKGDSAKAYIAPKIDDGRNIGNI